MDGEDRQYRVYTEARPNCEGALAGAGGLSRETIKGARERPSYSLRLSLRRALIPGETGER